jgi:hypothetical protein
MADYGVDTIKFDLLARRRPCPFSWVYSYSQGVSQRFSLSLSFSLTLSLSLFGSALLLPAALDPEAVLVDVFAVVVSRAVVSSCRRVRAVVAAHASLTCAAFVCRASGKSLFTSASHFGSQFVLLQHLRQAHCLCLVPPFVAAKGRLIACLCNDDANVAPNHHHQEHVHRWGAWGRKSPRGAQVTICNVSR